MKKTLLAATAVALTLALSACGSGSPAPSGDGESPELSVTLALATQAGCPFCIAVQRGAEAAAEERGIDLDVVVPRTPDASAQVQQLNSVLAAGPDLLLLLPYDATALVASAKQFAEKDIPVITIDTDISDTEYRLGVVSSDNTEGGRIAAEQVAELADGEGKVLYLGYQPGASSTDARLAGFEEGIAEFAGIDYLGPQFTNADPAQGSAKVSAVLKANPDLKVIFASDEGNALGAANALKEAGKDGEVDVVAFDGAPDEVAALEEGVFDVLIVQQAYQMGYDAMMQAADYLEDGTEVPSQTTPEFVVVTRDNLEDADVQKYLYPVE